MVLPDAVGAGSSAMDDAMVNRRAFVGSPASLIDIAESAKQVRCGHNARDGPAMQDDQTSNGMIPHLVCGSVE
jgi:hypothetical protein